MFLSSALKVNCRTMPLTRLLEISSILNAKRQFSSIQQGNKFTRDYKQYLQLSNGEVGSYFHDVPLKLDRSCKTVSMIVEVPRWSNAKFEISKELDYNPIVQDTKKGKVRFVHNIFPYHGYIHNYGALPQTWEDPNQTSVGSLKGDNDPLDCCEIGSDVLETGSVLEVKILGSLALIDDGELDWKVIAINVNDPLATEINNLNDVEDKLPGILNATREWFRNYKIPAGKPPNEFAFDGAYKDVHETIDTIQECNDAWKSLISSKQVDGAPSTKRAGEGVKIKPDIKPAQEIPAEVHKWSYVEARLDDCS